MHKETPKAPKSCSDTVRRIERVRVVGEFTTAFQDILGAQASTDRLCVNNPSRLIIEHCSREQISRAARAAKALHDYYSLLDAGANALGRQPA